MIKKSTILYLLLLFTSTSGYAGLQATPSVNVYSSGNGLSVLGSAAVGHNGSTTSEYIKIMYQSTGTVLIMARDPEGDYFYCYARENDPAYSAFKDMALAFKNGGLLYAYRLNDSYDCSYGHIFTASEYLQ